MNGFKILMKIVGPSSIIDQAGSGSNIEAVGPKGT